MVNPNGCDCASRARPTRFIPGRACLSLCCFAPFFLACVCAFPQQFPNPTRIATPADPVAVVSADFNEDGHQDIAYVTVGNSPTLHMLLGNGKGAFTDGAEIPLPAGTCTAAGEPCAVDVADFNNDGHMDILLPAFISFQAALVFVPGNGDGTFGTPVESVFPSSANPSGLDLLAFHSAVADFNGDGKLDIAVPDYYDYVFDIFLGDGAGKFTLGSTIRDNFQPWSIETADVNHDGFPDLIEFEQFGNNWGFFTWIGDGKGGFTNVTKTPTWDSSTTFHARIAADINGDGNVDIVGPDAQGSMMALTGNRDGSFNPIQTIATGFEPAIAQGTTYAADLTGSGIPALFATTLEGFDTVAPSSALHYGSVQPRTSGPFRTRIATADFNEDHAQDFAVGVEGGIQLFFGNATGQFPDATITPASVPVTFFFAADFNGDGISDVAALGTDGYFQTYLGDSTGTFKPPVKTTTATPTPYSWIGNVVGDFDGDGHLDMMENGLVLYGNGDGSFTPVTQNSLANAPAAGKVADLNKDGKSDFVGLSSLLDYPGSYVFGYGLVALLGNGNRTFTQVTTNFPTYTPPAGITTPVLLGLGDLDGDGFPDAAVYDANLPALEIWLGKGDGSFRAGPVMNLKTSLWQPGGAGGQTTSIGNGVIVDIDGDGKTDLAFLAAARGPLSNIPASNVLVIEFGDGSGGFASPTLIPLSHAFTTMSALKLDRSGGLGFAVSDGSMISVIRNLGSRQFSGEDAYSAGSIAGVLAGDFNGDGLDDLLALRSDPASSPNPGAAGFTVLINQAAAVGSGTGLVNAAIAVSPAQVNLTQPFAVTATIHSALASGPAPAGSVDFSLLGIHLGTATLTAGSATLQVPATVTQTLQPGIIEVTGTYSGDGNYASADLNAFLQILNPSDPTQTTLAISAAGKNVSNVQSGTFITLTAMVTAHDPVKYGYVAFFDGTAPIGQVQIANGQASISTNLLSIGSHSLTAQYLGYTPQASLLSTTIFLPSTSAAAPFSVTSVATTTELSLSGSNVTAGAVLTITAAVNSANGVPPGGVTFLDGSNQLGTLTVDAGGSASFTTASLAAGQHSISAKFGANGIFAASSASASTVTVNLAGVQLASTTTEIAALESSSNGTTATVQVSGSGPSPGRIALIIDGTLAATLPLAADGTAAVPVVLGPTGTHSLVASYAGDSLAAPSASPAFYTTAYAGAPDFNLREQVNRIRTGSDGAASMKISVIALGNWSATAALQCAGLPPGYACSFSPASVTGPGTTVLTVRRTSVMPALALIVVPFYWIVRRSRRQWLSLLMLLIVAILSVGACGRSPSSSSHSSVVTVEATGGASIHSVQFDLDTRQ